MLQLISGAPDAYLPRCWKESHCSLVKIVRKEPIPQPTQSFLNRRIDVHQFSIITELLGTPPEDVIGTIASENVPLIHYPDAQ